MSYAKEIGKRPEMEHLNGDIEPKVDAKAALRSKCPGSKLAPVPVIKGQNQWMRLQMILTE